MEYRLIIIILVFALLFLLVHYKSISQIKEGFIDVDAEGYSNVGSYNNNDNNHKLNLCNNFNNECVGTLNKSCYDTSIVACQKYEIKCENKCRNKKMDDNGNKEHNFNKCVKTCVKVKDDCCKRLNDI